MNGRGGPRYDDTVELRRHSEEPPAVVVPVGPDFEIPMRNGRPYDPAWDAWKPPRRWPGVMLSAVAIAVFIGGLAYHYSAHGGHKGPSFRPPKSSRIQPAYALPVPGSDIQRYSGRGNRSSLEFTSSGHFMVWDVRCPKCQQNFGLIVHDANNLTVDIPVNTLGPSQAVLPATYPKGTYYATVIADAKWTVSLLDPTSLANVATPFGYWSQGPSVIGPFSGAASSLSWYFGGLPGDAVSVRIYDASLQTSPQLVIGSSVQNAGNFFFAAPAKYYVVVNTSAAWILRVGG